MLVAFDADDLLGIRAAEHVEHRSLLHRIVLVEWLGDADELVLGGIVTRAPLWRSSGPMPCRTSSQPAAAARTSP